MSFESIAELLAERHRARSARDTRRNGAARRTAHIECHEPVRDEIAGKPSVEGRRWRCAAASGLLPS